MRALAVAMQTRQLINLFGAERVLLTPDCGFATFADNPVSSDAIAQATAPLRQRHRIH